jgi:hypothetical protein
VSRKGENDGRRNLTVRAGGAHQLPGSVKLSSCIKSSNIKTNEKGRRGKPKDSTVAHLN